MRACATTPICCSIFGVEGAGDRPLVRFLRDVRLPAVIVGGHDHVPRHGRMGEVASEGDRWCARTAHSYMAS
jgi:hypothetical protein